MSTQLNQVIEFPLAEMMGDGKPLPRTCGPQPGFVPYRLSPAKLRERARWRRRYLVGRMAFYRLQSQRAVSASAASFYRERASLFSRALRTASAKPTPSEAPHDLRDEIASWLVMADVIASEAHLKAEDYLYA